MKVSFLFSAGFLTLALLFFGSAQTAHVSIPIAYADTADTASSLQTQIDGENDQVTALNQKIAEYEADLQKVGADKKTLQSAINALDLQRSKGEAQIAATQDKIDTTKLKIEQLGSGITSTEQTIANNHAALEASIRSLDIMDGEPDLLSMLSSDSILDIWNTVDETGQIIKAVQDNVYALQAQKQTLAASQSASEQMADSLATQKKSLTSQQSLLAETKQSKTQLLTETNAEESNYQTLLNAAKAELNSFSTFTQTAGGSKLLSDQTVCDAWGCYYNQRDSAWGDDALDGTSYNLASDGCLITAMAMVMTHYGYHDVTPATINSDPNNFAPYYPAYLLFTIHVDGGTATRKTAAIDKTIAGGDPVVVGLHAYGGTHFVVLTSGSKGNYLMRDPYIANGKDISFAANYSLKDIYEISKVTVTS